MRPQVTYMVNKQKNSLYYNPYHKRNYINNLLTIISMIFTIIAILLEFYKIIELDI